MQTMTRKFTSVDARHRSHREESGDARQQKQARVHTPVLLRESLEALALQKGDVVVDATAGMAGHSEAIIATAPVKLFAFDADPAAAAAAQKRLGKKAVVINANFADMRSALEMRGVTNINKVLFDLGWNMTQLDAGRGFSFLQNEPLNMSYADLPRSGFTAAEALNEWSEKVLADVFFGYGEERYARRIAKAVITRREIKPFATTFELVEVVRDAVPAAYRHGRIHPATKTFQALRMAVNDEMGALEQGLASAWEMLAEGGRIAVITFHSIEDRAVKRFFVKLRGGYEGELVTKKPTVASREEVSSNAPSRSAKLRVITKLCTS